MSESDGGVESKTALTGKRFRYLGIREHCDWSSAKCYFWDQRNANFMLVQGMRIIVAQMATLRCLCRVLDVRGSLR